MNRILIAEDNERSRYLLEQFLGSRGYEVASAENGALALDMIRKNPPDLVISDIMMPVMNGYRLCRELKKDSNLKHIPLIFYTATFVEKEDERLALSLGAFGFLLKPASDADLEAAINAALSRDESKAEEAVVADAHDLDRMLDMYDNSIARKLAEKVESLQEERSKLVKSELRLKGAQEIAQVGHWEFNITTDQFLWSDEICRIFGFKPSETNFSHELMIKMVHPEDQGLVERSYRSLLEQMITYDITYRIVLQGGVMRYVNERGQSLCDDHGSPLSALGTIQDVTEQKTTELELENYKGRLEGIIDKRTEELKRAQSELVKNERMALLGQLATTISHELRNPLGTIGNVLDLIDDAMVTGDLDSLTQKVKLANRNVDRCDRIINELLEFSNNKSPQIISVEFDDQLKESLNDLDWPDDVKCELSLSAKTDVHLDPALLNRIVNNVVNNSLQALETTEREGKKVKIESMLQDKVITLSVQDNGHGMSKDQLEQVFEPLYSSKPFGVGLGMSIVKNAVQSLSGEITVDSIEGTGTSVVIAFPV